MPLSPGKKVAVIGPNANATQTLLSNYHGTNTVVSNHSILAALQVRGTTRIEVLFHLCTLLPLSPSPAECAVRRFF